MRQKKETKVTLTGALLFAGFIGIIGFAIGAFYGMSTLLDLEFSWVILTVDLWVTLLVSVTLFMFAIKYFVGAFGQLKPIYTKDIEENK